MNSSNNETTEKPKPLISDNEPEISNEILPNNNNNQPKTYNDLSNEILYFSINQDSK